MELLALEQCLPAIQNFLSGGAVDLRWFARKLTEKGLIHRQVADAVLNRQGTTDMERACGLMNAVVTQVEVDEEKYHFFSRILQDEGILSGLDKMLSKAYGTFNRLHAIDTYKRQTCAEDLHEGLKLADSLFSKGKWRVGGGVGGWVGPKDDCLLASLRRDPFCDTTSTLFTPNLTVEER